jgi:hypothetical protein
MSDGRTAQQFSVLEKRGREWIFRNSKNTMVFATLRFLKSQLFGHPNTLQFLILKYFYKTVVFSQNFENTLYPDMT